MYQRNGSFNIPINPHFSEEIKQKFLIFNMQIQKSHKKKKTVLLFSINIETKVFK
jgi:hypothetical protein